MTDDDHSEQHLDRVTPRAVEVRSRLVKRGLENLLARTFREVLFPDDRSIGSLYFRDHSDAGEIAWQVHSKRLGEAKGAVQVPIGKDLGLIITEQEIADASAARFSIFSGLLWLNAGDLQALVFPPVNIELDYFSSLEVLEGVKLMKIRLSQVGDQEVEFLKALTSLRWLCLWGEDLSEKELENLRNELPNCVVLTESSTEGLVNKNSAYTAKEMMEVLNEQGYRDENGTFRRRR